MNARAIRAGLGIFPSILIIAMGQVHGSPTQASKAAEASRGTKMEFNNARANFRENLWLSRSHGNGKPVVDYLKLVEDKQEGITFIHEWNGYFCFYSPGAVSLCKGSSLRPAKVLSDLPRGRSVLFEEKKIYLTLNSGPTRILDDRFNVLAEGTTLPYSGGFADVLGLYPAQTRIHIVHGLNRPGGNSLFTKTIARNDSKKPAGLDSASLVEAPGLHYQSLRFGENQVLLSGKGFHLAKLDGTVLSSHFQESPVRFGAVSPDDRILGAFGTHEGKWSYLEFGPSGDLLSHRILNGSNGFGRIAFDGQGNRYISTRKEIIKIGPRSDVLWARAFKGSNPSPAVLAIGDGKCALVDGGKFIVLNSDGTESVSVPVREKKVSSPPYLSESGQFYIGLSFDTDDFIRISFKP